MYYTLISQKVRRIEWLLLRKERLDKFTAEAKAFFHGFYPAVYQHRHGFPHERPDIWHWRKHFSRKLDLLLTESLRFAHKTGAHITEDLAHVIGDKTAQLKAVAFPTVAQLKHAAIRGFNGLAQNHGLQLRQRLAQQTATMTRRYAHAGQFKRYTRELSFRLARPFRDVGRGIKGNAAPLAFAQQIQSRTQRQYGFEPHSFHAPETGCIGKGKAGAPFESGAKVSLGTNKSVSKTDGVRLYAVGDIHGRLDLLDNLMGLIERDNSNRHPARTLLIFLGDYVDRGPDSKGVVDWLISARRLRNLSLRDRLSASPSLFDFLFLKGNHEHFLLSFLQSPASAGHWLRHGGDATLLSYGLEKEVVQEALLRGEPGLIEASAKFRELLPDDHLQFYQALELSYRAGDYFFVHAGISPHLPLESQSEEDLLWIRDAFLNWPHDFDAVIVHGHSPARTPRDLPTRIGIDTYAVKTGRLTAVGLEGMQRWFLST
jgi:serine/threonine protein phosphatase 1